MVAATADLPLETWSTPKGEDTGQLVTLELSANVVMTKSANPSLDTVSNLVESGTSTSHSNSLVEVKQAVTRRVSLNLQC